MKTFKTSNEIIILILLFLPYAYTAVVWEQLPDPMPIHYGINGNPDNYSSKTIGAILLPIIGLFVSGLMAVFQKVGPMMEGNKSNPEQFVKLFYKVRYALALFMGGIHILTLHLAMGEDISLVRYIPAMVFLLVALLGNNMNSIKQNWWYGIRTPWTLQNETIWRKTHQLAGKIWVYGGILFFGVSLIHEYIGLASIFVFLVVGLGYPYYYSYKLYKELKTNPETEK